MPWKVCTTVTQGDHGSVKPMWVHGMPVLPMLPGHFALAPWMGLDDVSMCRSAAAQQSWDMSQGASALHPAPGQLPSTTQFFPF